MTGAGDPRSWMALAREAGLDPGGPDLGGVQLRVVAVGWATVETERLIQELDGRLPGRAFEPGAPDELLGATARLARSADGTPDLVVLEPAKEGLLAALLARRDEGPAALYLGLGEGWSPAAAAARLRRAGIATRAGDGPLGPALLVTGRSPGSPQLLLVGVPSQP